MAAQWINIRAAVVRDAASPLFIEDLQLEPPRAHEILVKVVASGVCHTDDFYKSYPAAPRPIVLGHEGAGIVVGVGSNVTKFSEGDHVIMSFASCGSCNNCLRGVPGYCSHHWTVNFGGKRLDDQSISHRSQSGSPVFGSFFRQSSFATHLLCTEHNCIKVGKELDLRILGPLGCGIQTGAGAVLNSLKCPAGSKIVVFGSGGVGLSAIMAARLAGCATIIAVDLVESRLKLALELGATHVVNGRDKNLKDTLIELTEGGTEFALDTTGNKHVLRTAFEILRAGGVAGLIGGSAEGTLVELDMSVLLQGRTVRGIIQGDSVPQFFIPRLIQLWEQGRFPFDRLVKFYPFEEINQAFEDSKNGTAIKPVVLIDQTYKQD
eukprot:TRINITY_DN15199_c0_g1_i1.p1 TRINITY_DN15199_c0_g1~~TRINITY_DN15199_c0_g1_i1.p1  ORF type:complete len:378 (+),score=40.21 TRINITY_DN15199_c0_g1_i1:31-1164(+)